MIRNLQLRANVLRDGEIRVSLTMEFESAREFWFRQVTRSLAMLGTYSEAKRDRVRTLSRARTWGSSSC